jgi:hypothetical protein
MAKARGRYAFDRDAELEKIKRVLRADPTITATQLKERFLGRKQLVTEARKQLLEEGVVFPGVGERGITGHKRKKAQKKKQAQKICANPECNKAYVNNKPQCNCAWQGMRLWTEEQ